MVTNEDVNKAIERCSTPAEAIDILHKIDQKTGGLFGQNDCYPKRHYALSKDKDKVIVINGVDLIPPHAMETSKDKNHCRIYPYFFQSVAGSDQIQTTVGLHQLKTSLKYRKIHLTYYQGHVGFTRAAIKKIGFDPMEKIRSLEKAMDIKRVQCGKLQSNLKVEQTANTELRRYNKELMERIQYLQTPWFDKVAAKVKGAIKRIWEKREKG